MGAKQFSTELITSSGEWWEQAVNHRFFLELKKGEIKEEVFKNYLKIEYNFIDTAASTTGYAIAKAPDLQVKHRLANNIIDLATSQKEYFIKAADNLNFSLNEKIPEAVLRDAQKLPEHFTNISSNYSFAEILACMMGAELLYLTACQKIIEDNQMDNELIREWIYMHSGGDFKENVKIMQTELESCLPGTSQKKKDQMKDIFQQTLIAEIAFHNAPYNI